MSDQVRRGRLFWKYVLVLLVLVGGVLLVSSLIELYFSYQETKAALLRLEREKAVAAAAQIDQFVKDIERQLRWTSHGAFDDPRAARDQREIDFLRLLRNIPAIAELTHIDASGREQLRVSRFALDEIGSGRDLRREPKFTEPRAGKTYFSPVYFRNESEPYMTVAVAGGEHGAEVTTAEVNLKAIWDVISLIKLGKAGYAYAVDSLGHLIAHPDISLVLQKRDLSALPQVAGARAARREAAGDDRVGIIADGIQGGRVLTAHAAIAQLGWWVFVEQPFEEAFAPLRASIVRSASLFLLGLVLSVLASVALARRMVAPIRTLQVGAARIGAGDLGHRLEVHTGDELQALADEFNRSTARLQESYESLEQKVAARTSELARMVENLNALSETSQVLNSTLDVQRVLTTIVASAAELAGASGGGIYEYDPASRTFHVSAAHRMAPEHFEALRANPIHLGEGVVGRAGATGVPVQVPDIRNEAEFVVAPQTREILLRQGYRSVLAVPLLREQRLLGGLVVWRRETGSVPAEVVDTLQTFAAQSALAIQNARLFGEIQDKSRELEIASQHKSQFLANMSHELRTPLNAIIGYTELILDNIYGELPETLRQIVERVDRSGRHLLGLINDVLDLSKIEAGQLTLSITDYSMKEVVQAVVTAMDALAAEKRLGLKVSVPPDLPSGRGDERRITQVLLNLAGNAIKFTDAGEVRIEVTTANGAFVVSVTDTGPGIAEADQQRIFEEFRQGDSSSTRAKGGTGLGLSIARRIIELHGGRMGVESSLGQGSTFWFRLPVRVERPGEAP